MAIYGKVALQLLVDLINRDNPQLPFPLNTTDYIFGAVSTITPTAPDVRNTAITVTPKRSAPYIGALPLTYQRIDLGKLFNGVKLEVSRYVPTSSSTSFINHLMPVFNEKYGLSLTADDLNEQTWSNVQNNVQKAVTAKAGSYFCTGSMNVTWLQGKQIIGQDVLTVTDINGRSWPNGNDFDVDRTKTAEFFLADQDFTEISSTLTALGASGTVANSAGWQIVFAKIKEYTGVTFDIQNSSGGVNGKAFRNVTIPNSTYPDMARPGFNRCCQIDLTAPGLVHGYQGMMYIYYNV